MAATTWVTKPKSGRHWLLSNGKTIEAPEIEETSTGRKVRIAGTAVSRYSAEVDDLIWTDVENRARRAGGVPVMPIHRDYTVSSGWVQPDNRQPRLHFIGSREWTGSTTVWWKFRHSTLPIEAHIQLTISGLRSSDSSQRVTGWTTLPVLHPHHGRKGRWINARSGDTAMEQVSKIIDEGELQVIALGQREPLTWGFPAQVTRDFDSVRVAAREMLDRVRLIDEIDSISIPDMRNPKKPTYMKLELVDSNVTGEFVESLRDFLDTGPAMERAVRAYAEMRESLRDLGLVLEHRTGDDLLSALHAGSDALMVNCGSPAGEGGRDLTHTLVLRLATGTFIVRCGERKGGDKNEVAEKWDEARTIASITGEEPLLMGFARAYAEQSEGIRAQRILDANNSIA